MYISQVANVISKLGKEGGSDNTTEVEHFDKKNIDGPRQ